MADTVTNTIVYNGRYHVSHHINASDGTGETAAIKVDLSAIVLPTRFNAVPTYSVIDRIVYSVWGFNYVTLFWDHTTDDKIAELSGQGYMDWQMAGGLVDPRSAGDTGDIILTTNGGAAGSGYDITLWSRLKS